MIIPESDLVDFANDPANKIVAKQCLSNAHKVCKRFGGKIQFGEAEFIQDGTVYSDNHIWNILYVESDSGEPITQLIDIYNYKTDKILMYDNHRSTGVTYTLETFENAPHIKNYLKRSKTISSNR